MLAVPELRSFVPWQFSHQNPDSYMIDEQLVLRGKSPYEAKGWSRLGDRSR